MRQFAIQKDILDKIRTPQECYIFMQQFLPELVSFCFTLPQAKLNVQEARKSLITIDTELMHLGLSVESRVHLNCLYDAIDRLQFLESIFGERN